MKNRTKLLCKKVVCTVLSLLMAAAILPSTVFAESVDISDGLIGYWDFENVTGTTVPNLVENGTDGVLNGTTVSIAESDFGKSLHFSDDNASGYMKVDSFLNTGANSYSYSLWFKYSETGSNNAKNTVLLQQDGSGRSLVILTPTNKIDTYVYATDAYSTGAVTPNAWNNVILTVDASSTMGKYYINGVYDGQVSLGTQKVDAVTALLVGVHKNLTGVDPSSMKGDIDELRIYNKVLTDDEALAVYNDVSAVVNKKNLETICTDAEALLASALVAASDPAAVALSESITAGRDLLAQPKISADELNAAIDALNTAIAGYNAASPLILSVDTENVLRTVDRALVGINHRYAFNGYGSFDPETGAVKDDFTELYNQGDFGSIRYPGGTISNLFSWKESIGDTANRLNQIHGFYSAARGIAPNFGVDEIGTFAEENNSEIVYVYGMGRGSATDAADLVEYLNAEVGTNPNGGIAWADVRAENGHSEPYNVRYFEMGNEMQQAYGSGSDGSSSQGYWTDYTSSSVDAYINGGTVTFTRQNIVNVGDWNADTKYGNGQANQVKYLRYANTIPGRGYDNSYNSDTFKAVVEGSVHIYVNNVEWTVVPDITTAGAGNYVQINYFDGTVLFGDGTNGNIPSSSDVITATYQAVKDGFYAESAAMRDTMEQINELSGTDKEIHIYSSYEAQSFITKMNTLGYNDYYDGLTIHPYSGTPDASSTEAFYYDSMLRSDSAKARVQSYVNMMPEGKVPVISEYGIYNSTNPLVRSQVTAVYVAKAIMDYAELGSPYIQKHCLVDYYSSGADSLGPTQQAVIQAVAQNGASGGTGDYAFFGTPTLNIFGMYNNALGNQIVSSDFSRMPTLNNGVSSLKAMVSMDDENIYINVVNLGLTEAQHISLDIEGMDITDKTAVISVSAGESADVQNSLDTESNLQIETFTQVLSADNKTIELAPHSFTTITIPKNTDPEPTIIYGDVNSDNTVDAADAILVLQKYAELIDELPLEAADVNADNTVDSIDAILILQKYSGILETFPVENI